MPSEPGEETLDALSPGARDWVLGPLLRRRRADPWLVGLATFVLFSGVTVLLNVWQGTLTTRHGVTGLVSRDWITHLTTIPFLTPVLFGLVAASYGRIPRVFRRVMDARSLECRTRTEFFESLQKLYDWRGVNVILVVGIAVGFVWALMLKRAQVNQDWNHPTPGSLSAAAYYWLAILCVGIYVVLRFAYALGVTLRALSRMIRQKDGWSVSANLFHPDRCCGFGAIGAMVSSLSWLALVVGLMLSVFVINAFDRWGGFDGFVRNGAYLGPVLWLVGYVVLVPSMYVFLVLPAYRGIRKEQERFSKRVAHVHSSKAKELRRKVEDGEFTSEDTQQLEAMEEAYKRTHGLAWTRGLFGSFGRFIGTSVVPFVIAFVWNLIQAELV